ncbi:DUF6153 family protein [Psychromicrobium sp. YIM B11713]|uniref:DUF6153 family protein n=1 Tax=Psychromicrobium sp. YIM B11713 TaxID=3145233 RepID=UPI00374E9B84
MRFLPESSAPRFGQQLIFRLLAVIAVSVGLLAMHSMTMGHGTNTSAVMAESTGQLTGHLSLLEGSAIPASLENDSCSCAAQCDDRMSATPSCTPLIPSGPQLAAPAGSSFPAYTSGSSPNPANLPSKSVDPPPPSLHQLSISRT